MGIFRGPNIVRDNLHCYVDVASPRCYSGTGTTLTDLSGNGRNFTLVNGASVSGDSLLLLDGSNDYANYSQTFDWTSTPWTVEFWAKATDFAYPSVIDLINAGNGHFRFDLNSTHIRSQFRTPGGSSTSLVNYNTTITSGEWYFCSFTRSATTYKAYLNGILGATNTSSALNNSSGMNVIRIGYSADYDASDRTFEGSVGPVRIYSSTLSDTEVQQNYNAQKSRFEI